MGNVVTVDAGYFDITRGDKPFINECGNIDYYFQHIKQVEAIFDEALSSLGIRFNARDILSRSENGLRGDQWIAKFIRGETKGRIWPNQILTTVDIVKAILDNPGKSGICVGATLCGKTGTSNNCNWIPLILQLLTGERYILITLLPRSMALADQTSTERASFLSYYGDAELCYGEQVISLKRYFTQDLYNLFPSSIFNPSDQEANSSKSKSNVIRRVKGQQNERFIEILKKAEEHNAKIIFVIDESHYGAATDSVQDVMLNSKGAEVLKGHLGNIMVGFSATPWEHMNLINVWEVRHKLGYRGVSTYVGFNFMNGKPIDPTVKILQPNIMSLGDFSKEFKIENLDMIVPGWYKKQTSFEKALTTQKKSIANIRRWKAFIRREGISNLLPESWEQYKELCHKGIAEAINFCLLKKPFGGRGLLMRFVPDNNIMQGEEFNSGIRKYLGHEINILHYMQGKNEEAVEKAIKTLPEDQPYVVFVTGSGRMGDLFPPEVKYGFDFARDMELTPLQQGIPGRMCGHLKGRAENGGGFINDLPLIVLSHRPKMVLDEFIESKGEAVKRPNNRVAIVGEDRRGRSRHNVTIWREELEKDEMLKPIVDKIDKWLRIHLKRPYAKHANRPIVRRDNPFAIGLNSVSILPIWEILSERVLRHIEDNYEKLTGEIVKLPIELLRPTFDSLNLDDEGYCYSSILIRGRKLGRIGFRDVEKHSNVVGGNSGDNKDSLNLISDTLPASGNKKPLVAHRRELDLQIWIRKVQEGVFKFWQFRALRLRAVHTFKTGGNTATLPNDRAYTKDFRTEAETSIVNGGRGNDEKLE